MDDPDLVYDAEGQAATAEPSANPEEVALRLRSGERLAVPASLVRLGLDGRRTLGISFASLLGGEGGNGSAGAETLAIFPLVEETARIGKRAVETGRLRLTRRVETTEETAEADLLRESLDVERVPVNEYVDAAPAVRQDGDVTVYPVVEEVLVVEKRLLLREEVRLTRRQSHERFSETVTLRRSHVDVERVPPPPPDSAAPL